MFPAILAALGKSKIAGAVSGLLGGESSNPIPQQSGLLGSGVYDAPQGDEMQRRQALIDKRLAGQSPMPMQPSETIGLQKPDQQMSKSPSQENLISRPLASTDGLGQLSTGLGRAISGGIQAQAPMQAASSQMKAGMSFLKGPAPEILKAELMPIQSQPVQLGRYQRMFPTPRV